MSNTAVLEDEELTMADRAWRWSAAMGAIGIVLLLAALFLPGSPPKTSDSAAHLARVFEDKRRLFLLDTYLAGVGALAFLWFLAPLHDFLADHGRSRGFAMLAAVGGAMTAILILIGVALTTGICLSAIHAHDAAVVSAFADATNVLIELSKFGLTLMILAVLAGAFDSKLLGSCTVAWGAVAIALLLASALPPFLTDAGIWQFGGGVEVLGALPGAAWVLWLSCSLARSPSP
jgi:hypothetical protein